LGRLTERGYRRPGLFIERSRNARIHHRWGAGLYAFEQNRSGMEPVPPLYFDTLDRAEFCRWFRAHQPDVVIGHHPEAIEWMESCGARVPETHGFACINLLHDAPSRACAGLDQQPAELGARSAELLIAQLQRNERGIPEWPTTTTIPARWVEGPTLRPAPVAAA
jgi:LacI family transcriptional regulator